ncbi:MAG: two-component system, OmpR family, response regulator, partial [Solirubrobacteraceae bacterium]|nr:two-component system, OmpR family, response regulator [Solirubrobacteraceae bacterium]
MTDERSTILVVEDDDATRTFLADNLTADNYDLLVADTARDALRLLEHKFP